MVHVQIRAAPAHQIQNLQLQNHTVHRLALHKHYQGQTNDYEQQGEIGV